MTDEFDGFVAGSGRPATLETIVVEGAMQALRRGDAEAHNRLVASSAPALAGCDAIMLAHFSTSRAFGAVREAVAVPVLSAPDLAVDRMRALVTGTAMADRWRPASPRCSPMSAASPPRRAAHAATASMSTPSTRRTAPGPTSSTCPAS